MEDLDRVQASVAHEQQQLADLAAVGLDWDGEVVRQSERFDRYDEAIGRLTDAWQTVTDALGPLGEPLTRLSGLLSDTLDHVGPILLTPLLWLAVGAVVLVGGLPAAARSALSLPLTTEQVTGRLSSRLQRVRSHRAAAKVLELVTRRFEDLVDGVRVIAVAGQRT